MADHPTPVPAPDPIGQRDPRFLLAREALHAALVQVDSPQGKARSRQQKNGAVWAQMHQRQHDFYQAVDHLTRLEGFTASGADTAAEYLKTEGARHRSFFLRFGVGTGTFTALLLAGVTWALTSDIWPGLIGLVVIGALFLVGAGYDRLLDTYQTAESLLKSAAKAGAQAQGERRQPQDVEGRTFRFIQNWVKRLSIWIGVVIGVTFLLLVLATFTSSS